jgi:hypothetical protein
MMVRVFKADGTAAGPAFPAATNLSGNADGVGVAPLSGGKVLVAWAAASNGNSRVAARVVDTATGQPVGEEFVIATGPGLSTSRVVVLHEVMALPDGRAGVLYIDQAQDPQVFRLAVVGPNGSIASHNSLATSGSASAGIYDAAVALNGPNAGIIAVYSQAWPANPKIEFFMLDGSRASMPAFDLGPASGRIPALAARPDGGLAIAMQSGASAYTIIRVDAAGQRIGADLKVNSTGENYGRADLLSLPDGGLVLAASIKPSSAFNFDILAQRIKPDGSLDGAVVRLDSAPGGDQTRPQLDITGDGQAVVVFEDARSRSNPEIRAVRLDLGLGGATAPTDSTPPQLKSTTPLASVKSVAIAADLTLTFDEPVQRGTGDVVLKTASGKVLETFAPGSPQLTITGDTIRINPSVDLPVLTDIVLEVAPSAVRDTAGNALAALSTTPFRTGTVDGLYQFFVVAFAAAPGATYMGQLAEAWNHFSAQPPRPDMTVLQQIVEIFTTKKQFTDVYPAALSNRDLATQLVNNIVKTSASPAARNEAINDIDAALTQAGWSRGKMLYTVFGNLASKPLTDPNWGGTAKQFMNQLAVARHFTEEMAVQTENLATLRAVIGSVTPDTDVWSTEKIVQIIGSVPPGG